MSISAFGQPLDEDPDGDFDAADPYSYPGFRRLVRHVRRELIPKLEGSRMTLSLVMDGEPDVKWALEMGFSVMMDKPIIAIIKPGQHVPKKLAAVVDVFIEYTDDIGEMGKRVQDAIAEVNSSTT